MKKILAGIILLLIPCLLFSGDRNRYDFSEYLNADGSMPLTADWDAGPFKITTETLDVNGVADVGGDFSVDGDVLVVDANNNWVGINNDDPSCALDVNGDVKSSGLVSGAKVAIGNGTCSVPTLYFTDDPDTGIFRNAADSIGLTGGGKVGLAISPTSVYFYRPELIFEKNDTHDGTGGKFIFKQIRNIAPYGVLDGYRLGEIQGQGRNAENTTYGTGALIGFEAEEDFSTGKYGSKIIFQTCAIDDDTLTTRMTIDNAGVASIGDGTNETQISSTGNVLLPAGDTGAGKYPLKFQAGSNLTEPEAGTINYIDDGTGNDTGKFCITNVATCRAIDRTNDVAVETVTVANEAAETVLWTGPMPANSLRVGNVFKFFANGLVSNNGNSSANDFILRVRVGGLTGNEAASLNISEKAITDAHWHIIAEATQRTLTDGATAGKRAVHIHATLQDDVEILAEDHVVSLADIDTEANMDVVITIDWVTANVNNTISLLQAFMEYKN